MKIKREDLKDIYPLSPMQEGMLFHARQSPDSPAYTEQVAWRVRGAFDVEAYRAAWEELQARYDVLRSVFSYDKTSEPLQLILREAPLDFRCDAAPLALEAERRQPFDLTQRPPLRVRVHRIDAEEHAIVLTWHHILLDGWSTHLLLGELAQMYAARREGRVAQLPAVPAYARYVEWLQGRDRTASLGYWRTLLAGYDAPAELPRPGGPTQAFDLQHAVVSLDAGDFEALRSFAARANVTPSTLVQAAWGVVLGRYCDARDVVFGAVVSGRAPEVAQIERIPGLLINTVPVRATWTPQESFADLARRLQQQALESQPHHAAKLADVQQQTGLGTGLVRHLVVFENYPAAAADWQGTGLAIEVLAAAEPTSYDLVVVAEARETLRLDLQYNAAVYSKEQVAQLAGHLARFIAQAARAADAPLASLEILSQDQRRHLLQTLNHTERDYPRATLPALFQETVSSHGARTAIVVGSVRTSYAELDAAANQLAHHLIACGVRPGDRVATVMERSATLVVAILAILKARAAYVPLDPETPAERLAFIAADAGVRALVALTATPLRAVGFTRVAPDADAAAIAAQPTTAPDAATQGGAEDEAVLYYTSGSTGTPKAVRMPHRAIARLVRNTDYVELGPASRVAHASNVAFDAASFEIWGALANGGELHVLGREVALTPAALARELRGRGIDTLFLTTALFNQVARDAPDAFATLHTLLVGGEAVDAKWMQRVLARGAPKRLLNVYGPTENGTFSTAHLVSRAQEGQPVPIGAPIANSTALVVDRELRLQPLGAVGELLVGGDGLALGYHNRPELDAAAFIASPFDASKLYRTGDVVRRGMDGAMVFVGRRDAQLKLRGFRIEPGEVEAALRTFAGVAEALVAAHQNEAGERRLIAYVALPAAPRSIELDLRNHLRTRLPQYMIPSAFVVLDHLPTNANGKIDRAALPAPTPSGMGFGRTFVEPASDIERQLAAIWQSVLGISAVGRQDNFFELGGHSLSASTAVSRIRAELKVEVPIAAFFEAPTLAALGATVAQLQATTAPAAAIKRVAREVRQ